MIEKFKNKVRIEHNFRLILLNNEILTDEKIDFINEVLQSNYNKKEIEECINNNHITHKRGWEYHFRFAN